MTEPTIFDLPTTVPGLLPEIRRQAMLPRGGKLRRQQELGALNASVLNFREPNAYAVVEGSWGTGVSTDEATFEGWIRTSAKEDQTIFIGTNSPGASPRISIGNDQLSVFWSAGGEGPGWTSTDTTPVTDGQWHHIAVVFFNGNISFFKDGVDTVESIPVGSPQTATGQLQLGAGLGTAQGFLGEMWNLRVWSVARDTTDIQLSRWTTNPSTTGLTASISFDAASNSTVNAVGGGYGGLYNEVDIITLDTPQPTCALQITAAATSIEIPMDLFVSSAASTIEMWIQLATDSGNGARKQLLFHSSVLNGPTMTFAYEGGDQLSFSLGNDSFTSTDLRVISDGQWHHVAVVLAAGYVTFYKDGVACPDTYPLTASTTGTAVLNYLGVGGAPALPPGFVGLVYDVRFWMQARSTAQIAAYRWATLTGTETDLQILINFTDCDPSIPNGLFVRNVAQQGSPVFDNGGAPVIVTNLPSQTLPAGAWVYAVPGSSPIGPSYSPLGVLCAANGSTAAPAAQLQSVDIQTGQVTWTYDAKPLSQWHDDAVVAGAVTITPAAAYVGVTSDVQLNTQLEIHIVNTDTGALIGAAPVTFDAASFLTRPVPLDDGACVGVAIDAFTSGLAWGTSTDPVRVRTTFLPSVPNTPTGMLCDPILYGDIVFTAVGQGGVGTVAAYDTTSTAQTVDSTWNVPLTGEPTGNLTLAPSALYVPLGNQVVALDFSDGSLQWQHVLDTDSGRARQPVLLGSSLYVASDNGILYALDAGTGDELWRIDTGAPITTDLLAEDGILYFANQGDGLNAVPTFLAVDTASQGNDVLAYEIPSADTILFVQAGVQNGTVYFYSLSSVYAVNMAAVIREFSVASKLIVEDFTYPATGGAQGNNTSYRVTLTIRDGQGVARAGQAIKVWADDSLTIVNQGPVIGIDPTTPAWFISDANGQLTLAINAWDTSGNPQAHQDLGCPALRAWANFMAPDESIVIYPDHEQLTTLATVGGATPPVPVPGTTYLDTALAYDGTPLIAASLVTNTNGSLDNVAQSIRNTLGNLSPAVNAPLLSGANDNRFVRAGGPVANVLFSASSDEASTRPYVGNNSTFTVDLTDLTNVTYVNSYPSDVVAWAGQLAVGGIFGDIKDFADKVVKGVDRVVTMAVKATESAAETVIQGVEQAYKFTINSLEDAVTVVGGFFRTVLADADQDVRRVVQFLSALFDWDSIKKNHVIIKEAITNPVDGSGFTEQLQANLAAGDIGATFTALQAQGGSTQLTATATNLSGQLAGQTAAGNGDPDTAYNTGGHNNSTSCTFMHQKLKENAAGADTSSVQAGSGTSVNNQGWNADIIVQAWKKFEATCQSAIQTDFVALPAEIRAAVDATSDKLKDPSSIAGTAFTDLLVIFKDVADAVISFAAEVGDAILDLLVAVLDQLVAWLDTPIHIPFLSDLWKAISGDQLTLLDLICLIIAIPSTILLEVKTGHSTIPDNDNGEGKAILLAMAGFLSGTAATVIDTTSLYYTMSKYGSALPGIPQFWSVTDIAVDTINWALGAAVGQSNSAFETKDWVFWAVQSIPIIGNTSAMSYVPASLPPDGQQYQLGRDVTWGTVFLVMSAVYAGVWNSGYRDLSNGKGPGMVISANTLAAMSNLVELGLYAFDVDSPPGQAFLAGKAVTSETSDVISWIGNVLGGLQ
ncbi:outer membrane biogenesis protein BamB (plasmid) [Variovorax sp. PBS-H4]|uniref:LamG-like jellyroll fold domain-containing protein n=1 Tax=Variovorax sp. PBS-H4 TaxID=434008 RepID=UPI001316B182|nr:LamG-like jellyroll fold domain-containing protein [Variovorax sp. PBS-H4]VTU41430.1 outer membrane biogenesis protein BamB [Variovorax sp. PBS-H4]